MQKIYGAGGVEKAVAAAEPRKLPIPFGRGHGNFVMRAVIPSVLLGLRVALPQALVVTLVVEMFTGETGIGSLMIAAQRNFNAPGVFGLLAVMGIFGYCLTARFGLAERIVLQRWPSSP